MAINMQQQQPRQQKTMLIRIAAAAVLLGTTSTTTVGVDAFAPTRQTRSSTSRFSSLESSSTTSDIPECFINFFDPDDSASQCDNLSAIDNSNVPPSLRVLLSSLSALRSGSDIRGPYVSHGGNAGTILSVSQAVRGYLKDKQAHQQSEHAVVEEDAWTKWGNNNANIAGAALTPFASYCLGASFAAMVKEQQHAAGDGDAGTGMTTICLGRDPRPHGERLADSFARGAEGVGGVRVHYAGLATTPAMYEFARSGKCDAAVMVTASHLPEDKNGFKLCTAAKGEFTNSDVGRLIEGAQLEVRQWFDLGLMPPSSGYFGVYRSETVDYMAHYEETLKD